MRRLGVVALLAAACSSSPSVNDGGAGGGTGGTVSFSSQILPMLNGRCAGSGISPSCHGMAWEQSAAVVRQRLLETTSPQSACASRRRVEPGSHATSLFFQKLAGTADCGIRMPAFQVGGLTRACSGTQCFDAAQLDLIRTWIDEGAQDN